MCVIAHPDDECYAFGGALALAADRGIETYVICLTDGQAATNRGSAASGEELARIRSAELAASCKVLGVSRHVQWDYPDGQLQNASLVEVAGKLVAEMRQFRPEVVLTFGGDGGSNRHPDHMMTSFCTTAAFHWAGQENRFPEAGAVFQPERLFHQTTNYFRPGRQPQMPAPWTVVLDIESVRARRDEAFRQHVSQAALLEITKDLFAQYGGQEFYTLMTTRTPMAAEQITDLFE